MAAVYSAGLAVIPATLIDSCVEVRFVLTVSPSVAQLAAKAPND